MQVVSHILLQNQRTNQAIVLLQHATVDLGSVKLSVLNVYLKIKEEQFFKNSIVLVFGKNKRIILLTSFRLIKLNELQEWGIVDKKAKGGMADQRGKAESANKTPEAAVNVFRNT